MVARSIVLRTENPGEVARQIQEVLALKLLFRERAPSGSEPR